MIRFENRNVNTATVYSFPHQPVAMAVFICTLCLCIKAPFHRNRKGAWEIRWSSTRSWGPGPAGGRASPLRSIEASWLLVDAATCHRWRMRETEGKLRWNGESPGDGRGPHSPSSGLARIFWHPWSWSAAFQCLVWKSWYWVGFQMWNLGQNLYPYNLRLWISTLWAEKENWRSCRRKVFKRIYQHVVFSTSIIWMVSVWMC